MNLQQSVSLNDIPDFTLTPEQLENIRIEARESAEEDYLKELEAQHKKELASINWLEVFPDEAKKIIPQKIKELLAERRELLDRARLFQQEVRAIAEKEKRDEFFVWFWAEAFVKYNFAVKIVEIDKHLARMRRELRALLPPSSNPRENDRQKALEKWEDDVRRAKEYSLETLTSSYLEKVRQFGNQIKALCPFHEERTPSFVIYLNDNHFHCYGCGKHGDSIAFLMEKEGIDFKEAVRRLAA